MHEDMRSRLSYCNYSTHTERDAAYNHCLSSLTRANNYCMHNQVQVHTTQLLYSYCIEQQHMLPVSCLLSSNVV
jgi:hypothetical protein